MKNRNIIGLLISFLSMSLVVFSCKEYADPPQIFEKTPDPIMNKERKVLLVSIDGLAGVELQKYIPVNMGKLLEKSKYTLEAISDGNTKDAASWTTILSGKSSVKHGVNSNDFDGEDEDIDENNHEGSGVSKGFVSIFRRLLETGKNFKTLTVTPWAPLDQFLFNLSNESGVVESDAAVRDKGVERIKNQVDLSFAVINFRGLNEAGKQFGFSMDKSEYKGALDQIDGYLGEIVQAISERKNIGKEDWLIVVTSNHGGKGNSYGGASFEERKVPLIFHHANFVKQEFRVENLGQFVQLGGSWAKPIRAVLPASRAKMFNFGVSGEYTVQLKINLKDRGGIWPGFFGKGTADNGSAIPGWAFMFHDPSDKPNWRVNIGHQKSSNKSLMGAVPVSKQEWTTLTMKIYEKDGKRYVKNFTNGSPSAKDEDITGHDITNDTDLVLGGLKSWESGNTANFDVSDIRVYKKALPDDYIVNNYCKSGVKEGEEFYGDLIAYWPINEGGGTVIKDIIGNADMTFNESPVWTVQLGNFCVIDEDKTTSKRLLHVVDILPQIYYWLNIKTVDSWSLEGRVFLKEYEKEFVFN